MIADYLYGVLTSARNSLFDCGLFGAYISKLPVLSVGNLSVGGNGKTPLCIYIAQRLQSMGRRPVVLLRGYGGAARGPRIVAPDDAVTLAGDEAVMLAQSRIGRVLIARRRVAGTRLIERSELGDVIILDDGFQHRWLARKLDIIALDASSEESIADFIQGRLLPGGRFRENRNRGLARAHAVVINSRSTKVLSAEQVNRVREVLPANVLVFSSHLRHTAMTVKGSAVAVCGLANPGGFFESVRSLGFSDVIEKAFPDHHIFTAAELDQILEQNQSSQFICSPKDFVRLPDRYRQRFTALTAGLVLSDPERFDHLIRTSLS